MSFSDIFLSWFPIFLLIAVWLVFMSIQGKKEQKSRIALEKQLAQQEKREQEVAMSMEKQMALIERVVIANERMAESLELIASKK